MKKIYLIFLIFCIFYFSLFLNNSAAYENIIKNGDFSKNLYDWLHIEYTYQHCSGAFSEAYVENDHAAIHTYLGTSDGSLYQSLNKNLPFVIEFNYELRGGCSGVGVKLKNNSSDVFIYYLYSNVNLAGVSSTYVNISHIYTSGIMYSWIGKIKLEFDYENNKLTVYFNNVKIDEYRLELAYINGIELKGRNTCCDGRNNGYAYFDNITLIPYAFATEDIPPPTNRSVIITDSDWKNVISASAVKLPVLVSESGGITPEIERFISDYQTDQIYTIGFSSGLNSSFEIVKEQIPGLFFPNASMAVYANSKERGIFASQLGYYLGLPVVFEKTWNYSEIIDLESMSLQEIQDFHLGKVKERGGNVDYMVLADLNSAEGLLAGRLAGFRNGYIVPVENKSFEWVREAIKESLGILSSKKFYHTHVKYKAGKPLYLGILGGNESVPFVRFFDPGLEIFNDKDGWYLYSDLGYADSNGDGYFDLAIGRIEGGLGPVSLHMARELLPKNQSAVLIGEYRHPRIMDLKFFGGGMTQAFIADMILEKPSISVKRIVEDRISGKVPDNMTMEEAGGRVGEIFLLLSIKQLLNMGGILWGLLDASDNLMYYMLEFDWKGWFNSPKISFPEHLEIIDGNLSGKIGSPGIIGYFGVGEKEWFIPREGRYYLELVLKPYENGMNFSNLSFSGFLYDDHDMSANSTVKEKVVVEGGGVLGSSGTIHDPYTMRTSSVFFAGLVSGKPVGQALIDSVNINPVQSAAEIGLLDLIYIQTGQVADVFAAPLLYTKDRLGRILFSDPAATPLKSALLLPKIVFRPGPSDSFRADSWIGSNYTINGSRLEVTNADDYLLEREMPIVPVFVREFILPENAVLNWVNASGNYSLEKLSPEFIYNDSYYTNWTEITINCINSLNFGGLDELNSSQEEEVLVCAENAMKPHVEYPYPNSTFWWRESKLLDNRTLVYVFVPSVLFENESFAFVLENASVEVDYEAGAEMNVFAHNVFVGENETVKIELMNLGPGVSGKLWVFVEGNGIFEFSENVTIPESSNLTREFSFAPELGDYEVVAVFESENSIGPRYAYFSVEEPPKLVVEEIPEIVANDGESGIFQIYMKNNGSFLLENMSISYSGLFVVGFESNWFNLSAGETKGVNGFVNIPDMHPPGKYAGVLSFVPENDRPVSANLTVVVLPRAVPETSESEWIVEIGPGKYAEKSLSLGNSGNVPLDAGISCGGFVGILCGTTPQNMVVLPGEQKNFSVNISIQGGYPAGDYTGKILMYGNEFSQPETKEIPVNVTVPEVAYWSVQPMEWVCHIPGCSGNFSLDNSLDSNAPFYADIFVENLGMVSADANVSVEPRQNKNFSAWTEIPPEGLLSGVYTGNIHIEGNEHSEPESRRINVTLIATGPEFTLQKEFSPGKVLLFWKQFAVPKINHVEIYLNNTGEIPIEKINVSDGIHEGWKGRAPVLSFVKRNRKVPVKEFSFSHENGYANFSFDFSAKPLQKGEGLEIHYMIYAQPEFVPAGNIETQVIGEARTHENIYSRKVAYGNLGVEYFDPPTWLRWLFVLIYRLW